MARVRQAEVGWEAEAPGELEMLNDAYGTCGALGILWACVVDRLLPFVGAKYAAQRTTTKVCFNHKMLHTGCSFDHRTG